MSQSASYDGWIGRNRSAEDILTPRLADAFQATLAPHLAPWDETSAPLGLHWCLAPDTAEAAALGSDGHPAKGGFLPPVPLPRRMWASGELEFLAPLRVGDRVRRTSTVADVVDRSGRSGPLTFVTVRHEIATDSGTTMHERHDIVYREAGTATRSPSPEPEPENVSGEWRVSADPVLLFRYSALTFNGHRIHYDHPYATGVEGYPGLVVHAPLQATVLLNLAATVGGSTPRHFSFRALSPAVAPQVLRAVAAPAADGGCRLQMRSEAGRVTVAATARW